MALSLNLEKSAQALTLSLEKVGILQPPKVEVGFGLDVSGSFEDEHRDGSTNTLMARLAPWGLVFDPDKKMDVFTFSNGAHHVKNIGAVDATNYADFVPEKVIGKVPGWCGGTDYSYLLEEMLKNFGWMGEVKKAGLFGKMFGQKDKVINGEKKRSLAIIATDGDNSDKSRTMQILSESKNRKDQVYFLFLGICNGGSEFPFLEKIGEAYNNTGFVKIDNLKRFNNLSDDELNKLLINEELLSWLKA